MARTPAVKQTLCKFFERGECERGDQCTWAHGVEELGAPNVQEASDDALFEALAAEVPVEAPVRVMRTICKFWQDGRCKNGEFCTWAHGEHELGVPVPQQLPDEVALDGLGEEQLPDEVALDGLGEEQLPDEVALDALGEEQLPDDVALDGRGEELLEEPLEELQPVEPAGRVKKTICKFWQEGKCKAGDQCTWAHGEDDLGMPIVENSVAVHGGPVSPVPLRADRGPPPEQEAPGGVKRTVCKFWLEGKCRNGESCTWAHGDEEIGTPAPRAEAAYAGPPAWEMPTPRWKGGKGGPFSGPRVVQGKGSFGKATAGKGIAALLALGGEGQWGAPAWDERFQPGAAGPPVKRTLCRFWQQGLCNRGDQCTWLHGDEDAAPVVVPPRRPSWQAGGPSLPPLRRGPGEGAVRRTICKFWQEGTCKQSPGQCTYAHGEQELGTMVANVRPRPQGREPCRFFLNGICEKGNLCNFSHIIPTPTSQAPTSQVIPPWKRPRFS